MAQGFKALASRIHEQLPLSPRESHRLLTALTSSFRKHLDEVHPKNASEDGRPRLDSITPVPQIEKHAFSSAALADRHLASVLTSPLLAKPASTSTRAARQAALEAEFAKSDDPVALLESYEKTGNVTAAVAGFCARQIKQMVRHLAPTEQVKVIKQGRYGTGLLGCFWRANLHVSGEFVENHELRGNLVWAVMMEGRDEFLWEWLKCDIKLPQRHEPGKTLPGRRGSQRPTLAGKALDDYRWKGRLLRSMAETAFQSPFSDNKRADAAIKIYLKAQQARLDHPNPDDPLHWLPLEPCRNVINKTISVRGLPWLNTDPKLFEALIDACPRGDNAMTQWHRATLWLHHPTKPTAEPAYRLLRAIYVDDTSLKFADRARDSIENPRTIEESHKIYMNTLMLAVARLRASNEERKAHWVLALAAKYYPTMQKYVQKDMADIFEEKALTMPSERDLVRQHATEHDHDTTQRVTFPFPQVS